MKRQAAFARMAVFALLLGGCAGVGVPATDDPWKQYLYGCALLEAGRTSRAEEMLRPALRHYERSDEYLRLAMVEMEWAKLIESPGFVIDGFFARQRAEMGGREALPQRAREFNARAKANLLKALAAPPAQASPAERTQVLLFLIDAHARLGEKTEACATIERAADAYRQAGGIPYPYAIYRAASVPEHLESRRELYACGRQGS
ncbi:MAG TPA: hypothetical protein VFP44_13365 [Usitatibacter sp.]|nr:hypothetical protein [Usitatibacter sp.]